MPEDIERSRDLQEKLDKEIKKMLEGGNKEFDRKNYPMAAVIYTEILGLDDRIPTVWLNRGTACLNWGAKDAKLSIEKREIALECFDRVLMLNPRNPTTKILALMLKAIALGSLKKWKEARIFLQKGLKYAKRSHKKELMALAEEKLRLYKDFYGEDKV